jgi:hypothetical protein
MGLLFFLISVGAGILGFTGISAASAGIARILESRKSSIQNDAGLYCTAF